MATDDMSKKAAQLKRELRNAKRVHTRLKAERRKLERVLELAKQLARER